MIMTRGVGGLIPTKVSREFAAVGQHAAGLGSCGCGCGGSCGCDSGGLGQFTATTLPALTITTAAPGTLMLGTYDASFLQNDVSLGGYNVPFWAFGIVAVGIAALAFGGKRL